MHDLFGENELAPNLLAGGGSLSKCLTAPGPRHVRRRWLEGGKKRGIDFLSFFFLFFSFFFFSFFFFFFVSLPLPPALLTVRFGGDEGSIAIAYCN